jgi:hypothetical protein
LIMSYRSLWVNNLHVLHMKIVNELIMYCNSTWSEWKC